MDRPRTCHCGQTLIEDQQYPEDGDGYWSCPAYMAGDDAHDSIRIRRNLQDPQTA